MTKLTTLAAATAAALLLAWTTPANAKAKGPMAALKNTHGDIDKLLAKKPKKGSAQAAALDRKIKARVNGFLNYKELARRSLSRHWEARTEAERSDLVAFLEACSGPRIVIAAPDSAPYAQRR